MVIKLEIEENFYRVDLFAVASHLVLLRVSVHSMQSAILSYHPSVRPSVRLTNARVSKRTNAHIVTLFDILVGV